MDLNNDKLLTRKEVCEKLGICIATFYKLDIPIIQIQRRVFVKQSDLEKWIDLQARR